MSDARNDISEEMLHGYVDGQLCEADRRRVEAWLAAHPEKAREVADWQAQNEALRRLFPAPRKAPPLPREAGTAAHVPWRALAAGLALLGLGLAGGWFGHSLLSARGADGQYTARLIEDAINAHVVYASDPVRPVEISGKEEDLLIRWLSKRLGHALTVPDLSAQGFRLVGGRLLPSGEGPAAQFMYEDDAGHRITLFAVRDPGGRYAAFRYRQQGETGSFYWQDEHLAYALVGDLPRKSLLALANDVYRQLS